MWRTAKLVTNFFIASVVFTYFIEILVLLLNPHISVSGEEFFWLFIQLYIFYGPLWFLVLVLVFVTVQFFSEKKYSIGILKPPTITYFLSFTILLISLIFYFNYEYYFEFFQVHIKFNFIRILLLNLALVITGIAFLFFKRVSKTRVQALFLALLAVHSFHSYISVMQAGYVQEFPAGRPSEVRESMSQEFRPRKIRIVIMQGLSLNIIQSLTAGQKLLNFNEIIKKGVIGRIRSFTPNLDLSMLNAALTGRAPSGFGLHSHDKYKFTGLDYEFDVRPRYIFFRKSPFINSSTFYKREDNHFLDNIQHHYRNRGRQTLRILRPPTIERYSQRALYKNNRFVHLFSDLLEAADEKYEILKKSFFLDDYLKNLIPELKDSPISYSVSRLPGLGVISKYFYQYHLPQIFGTISRDDIRVKKYGWLIEKYYEYYDSIVGNLMSTTGDDELLVILSFCEYQPLPVWRRILLSLFGRKKDIYVYKSPNALGTLLMYEKSALKSGYSLKTISIYDIYPTLLYYAGFQLSRDLRGEVLRELFIDEFLLNNPIDIVTGYTRYP